MPEQMEAVPEPRNWSDLGISLRLDQFDGYATGLTGRSRLSW